MFSYPFYVLYSYYKEYYKKKNKPDADPFNRSIRVISFFIIMVISLFIKIIEFLINKEIINRNIFENYLGMFLFIAVYIIICFISDYYFQKNKERVIEKYKNKKRVHILVISLIYIGIPFFSIRILTTIKLNQYEWGAISSLSFANNQHIFFYDDSVKNIHNAIYLDSAQYVELGEKTSDVASLERYGSIMYDICSDKLTYEKKDSTTLVVYVKYGKSGLKQRENYTNPGKGSINIEYRYEL